MSKQVNKSMIGIFMVSAVALLVAAILILGSGKFFKERPAYVMFFEGSVQGLAVGSPVVFRGVKVGEVTDIKMQVNPENLNIRIPVTIELGEAKIEAVGGKQAVEKERSMQKRHPQDFARKMIEKGLRAQLAMQSIVTGQLMVALDFYPDKPAKLVGEQTKYPEIPTIPTTLQELAKRVEKIPIEEILNNVKTAADGISKMVNSPEITDMLKSVNQGVGEARSLIRNVDRQVGPAMANLNEASGEFKKLAAQLGGNIEPIAASLTKVSQEAEVALKKAQGVFANMESMTEKDSAARYQLAKTLVEFESAARSVRILADMLEQQPEALIYGKKKGVEK